jgi:hypothetical protein
MARREWAGKIVGGVIALVLAVFFAWLIYWRFNVPLTFSSPAAWWTYGLFVVVVPLTIFLLGVAADMEDYYGIAAIPIALLVVLSIILSMTGARAFNAYHYAAQINVADEVSFTDGDLPSFDPTKIPWIDARYAEILGDQRLGELGAVGASVEVGEYHRQLVNGQLFYVAPILHRGFFQRNEHPNGTPGFIMVNMTDDRDVRLVTDNPIRIQPSGHGAFNDKLERVVQRAAPSAMRFDPIFLVDDDLRPYWITPIRVNRIGAWGGADVDGLIVVNATTGETARYNLDNVPEWIDRVYPTDLLETQLSNWGSLRNGWWNSTVFGRKSGMLQTEPGNAIVYHNGSAYLFDALTSRGTDSSTVGFVVTNLRTRDTRRFSLTGATEAAAMLSAQGDERVAAQRFVATFPLPVIIEGQVAYFMALADPNSGIVQQFALVNVQRHQIVGIGNTPRAAEADYRMRMHSTGAVGLHTPSANLITVEGTILRWGQYSTNGNTFFTFIVEGHESRLFKTDTSQAEAVLTQVGDRVRFYALITDNVSASVMSFSNLEFDFAMGELERQVTEAEMEQRLEDVRENPTVMDDGDFLAFWELLTPAQREAFLERSDLGSND